MHTGIIYIYIYIYMYIYIYIHMYIYIHIYIYMMYNNKPHTPKRKNIERGQPRLCSEVGGQLAGPGGAAGYLEMMGNISIFLVSL